MHIVYVVSGCVGVGITGAFASMQLAQQATIAKLSAMGINNVVFAGSNTSVSAIINNNAHHYIIINAMPINNFANLC